MIWKVTPVRGGTYSVNYEVAAGLFGKAKAVTADGSKPSGKFLVTISTKPPRPGSTTKERSRSSSSGARPWPSRCCVR